MVFSLNSLAACFESASLPFKIQPNLYFAVTSFFTYILLAMFLSHLIETEEFSDLSIADFMVKSSSAFEKLFEDQSQMNVSFATIIVLLFSKHAIVISTKTSYVSVSSIIKYYKIKAFTIPMQQSIPSFLQENQLIKHLAVIFYNSDLEHICKPERWRSGEIFVWVISSCFYWNSSCQSK